MTEYEPPVQPGYLNQKPQGLFDIPIVPSWARCETKYAQNILESSDEPIEYDHDDEDYRDNCFFFPEDCFWSPPKGWVIQTTSSENLPYTADGCYDTSDDIMIPGLPDIKMLDADALSDLLEDNLSPPEITSIMVFATNGAIFAYASPLPSRQLRNLSATYGAAYTCYAKNASNGNLTGVNPASHPSSYITAPSVSLGDVGSIVFELDDTVAVVTRIADKVLLAAVGSTQVTNGYGERNPIQTEPTANGAVSGPSHSTNHSPDATPTEAPKNSDAALETQYQIDRSSDLARLASLNLSAPPAILLALESKSAALGKFLGQKLEDLQSPEDF
ncbi:hypothetical protein PHISCL_08316 [Aspergillus sclerotialis]|uniref:Uncharacterized protein n=1 Tax=Aspergillus sclerotialis TaxID=2070753 RepID=A0A3A2ZJ19_9EURO|nr:hypothetical protein PHISCL_08316 [Aspergillus sclerotialis]